MTQQFEQYPETYIRLLNYIRHFAAENDTDRLPSEDHLAEQLGVSRMKIRDVLSQLQAAGYISRRRGIGTMINRYVLQEKARLDIDAIYTQMIEECGHKARSVLTSFRLIRQPNPDIIEHLKLHEREEVYEFCSIAYADESAAILTFNYIPATLYENGTSDLSLMDKNIFFFLQGLCDNMLENIMVHMDVCAADPVLSRILGVSDGFPLMNLKSVCYTQASDPILYSMEYFNTKVLPFSFQKRILIGKFNPSQPPEF